MTQYFNGDDIVIDLNLTDVNGDALPPSNLNSYSAELRQDLNGDLIAETFDQADFDVLNDGAGSVRLRIGRDQTADLPSGIYNLFVKLIFNDADAQGGVRHEQIETQPFEILRR